MRVSPRTACLRVAALVFFLLVPAAFHGQAPAQSSTQSSAPKPRIVDKIDDNRLVTLTGNTHPSANAHNDQGPVDPALRMTDLILVLSRGKEQQAAFDAFVASQYDPTSAEFHHWLPPAEVGQRFGPAPADIATISAWLAGHGFSVDAVSKDQMNIRFSGTAAEVESAFHTSIHNLTVNGENHIANMTDPRIPAALAPVVLGIKALHSFIPRPVHRLGGKARFNPHTGAWQRIATPDSLAPANLSPGSDSAPQAMPDLKAAPQFGITVGSGSSAYTVEDVAPYDFATIYNMLPLWTNNIDGTGQTIAIAGTSDINVQDVATFRSTFGLPAGTPPRTIVANGVDPGLCVGSTGVCTIGDQIENSLDVEWSGAVAKGADVVLVVSGPTSPSTDTVYSSAQYVIDNLTARILNVSYGACELDEGTSGNAAYNALWETAATEGIAVFVAAGDSGSASCDQGVATSLPYGAQFGTTVSGLSSTPYNTSVGGTDFNWGTTASNYWTTTNNPTTGASARNYVPEVPWNDTCTNPVILSILQTYAANLTKAGYSATSPTDAESACNFVNQWYKTIQNTSNGQVDLSFLIDTVGGSGGASNCTISNGQTLTSCTGGYPKPTWQAGVTGIPADNKRDLPDVSFFASNGFLGSAYLICVSANGSCVTSTSLSTEPTAQEVGGTSVASPAMAGVMALINQKTAAVQGSPNAELYRLAARQTYSACRAESVAISSSCYFNDIDTGTNAMACNSGSQDCTVNVSGDTYGVLSGYSATTGFDNATGLGSLNIANVVNAWTSPLGSATAAVAVTLSHTSVTLAQSLTVTVTVSGSSGTPTGTVAVTAAGYTASAATLAGGAYTFTIPAGSLTVGSDTLNVSYSGDSNYALASQTATVNVTKLNPTATLTASPTTVGANTTVALTVSITGAGASPTGTVSFSGGGAAISSCSLVGGACSSTIAANALSNGSDPITASYSGDTNYNAATATATVTVNILHPTITLTPSATSLTTVNSVQLKVTLTGTGATPTGTVMLSGLYLGATQSGTLASGTYTFTVAAGTLAGGSDTLIVSYNGDTTYGPNSGSTTLTVTKANATIAVTPGAASVATNASLPVSVTVTSSGGGTPTGSVTLSAGSYSTYGFLASGAYTFTIPAGVLAAGTDTLSASYVGDSFYNSANQSASVSVTQFTKIPATLTVTPASSTVSGASNFNVAFAATGSDGTPTGTATVAVGSYTLPPANLVGGQASFSFPAGSLSPGSQTITASYSGDPTYLSGTATSSVTVTPGSYSLSATAVAALNPGTTAVSTITVLTTSDYQGVVTLSCALTSSPSGAINQPSCSPVNGSVTINSSAPGATATVTVTTTGPTVATLPDRKPIGKGTRGSAIVGGVFLAMLALLGIPARRRSWRSLLGVCALFAALVGGVASCGGSSSSGGGTGSGGTTAGSYTFTVTGTGNPAVTPAPTTTFTVTVN